VQNLINILENIKSLIILILVEGKNMIENRRSPRVDLTVIIDCMDFIESVKIKAKSKNISQTGICITTQKSLPKGRHVDLLFNLPADIHIKAIAEVKWSYKIEANYYANGLAFSDIKEQDVKKIEKYIEEEKPSGTNIKERRKAKRILLSIVVNYIGTEAEMKNISQTGMCITCEELLPRGRTADIMFFLPTNICINAMGRVIWRNKILTGQYEYGIDFIDIKKGDVDKVKIFMRD